jgi:hypothetical protein
MSHKAMSIAAHGECGDAAGKARRGGGTQFGCDRLGPQWVIADDQIAEFSDGGFKRGDKLAAESRDADAFDSILSVQLQRDEVPHHAGKRRSVDDGLLDWEPDVANFR